MKKIAIALIILLAGAGSTVFAQKKYVKILKKAEDNYEIGDSKKALETLEKFRKKAFKKLGAQNQYTTTYYIFKAKYNLEAGFLNEFEPNIQSAITASLAINGDKSQKHAEALIGIAELYAENSDFKAAKGYLVTAKKILDEEKLMTPALEGLWNVNMTEVLDGQGFYNEALAHAWAAQHYYRPRAVRQESYVDAKGALKSRRVPDEEIKIRFNEYARVLTDIGTTYCNQGDKSIGLDTLLDKVAPWIKRNLGTSSLAYARNQYNAGIIYSQGENVDLKEADFAKTLNFLKASHKASHPLGVQLYEAQLKRLQQIGSDSRYSNLKVEFEKLINANFKRGSIYYIRSQTVEFNSKLDKDRTRNLERNANNLISNNPLLPRNSVTTIGVLEFLYGMAIQEKQYANAERYLQAIGEIKTALDGEEAPEAHLAKIKLANFYIDYTNNFKEAGKIYDEDFTGVVEKEIKPMHKDMLDILNHMAVYYELTDNYTKAPAVLAKAKDVALITYDNKDPLYAAELTNVAKMEIKLGQYESAEADLNVAIKILDLNQNDAYKVTRGSMVNAIETQAVLYGIKGLFDDAEDNLDKSRRIIKKNADIVGIDELSTAKELSSLFIQLGRYALAKDLIEKLIADTEKLYGSNSIRLIDPLVNQSRLTLIEGDYTKADKMAQRANQIAVSFYGDKSSKTAPTQKVLSDIDYMIGDYENAEDNIQKALVSQEKQFGRQHIEVAKSLSQLALIKFYKNDDRKEVEKLMLESRDIMGSKLGKDNPQYAEILKNVATLYISEKRFDIAFSSLTQAEAIWRVKSGTKNNINAAAIYTLTGDVYYQLKNYNKAEDFYDRSKDLYEKFFSNKHPEYVKVLSKLAKVRYMQKDFKGAKKNIEEALANYDGFIKQYFPALSEREKAKYWNTIKGDFEFYNTLAFSNLDDFKDLTGKVYNYQLLTKALLLSSSIKIRERILNSNDEALKANFNLWTQKKEFLNRALSMSTQQLTDNGVDLPGLTNEVEKLERDLSEKSELFGQSFETKKITYENVQKAIGKNDVATEIIRYRHFNGTLTDSIVYVALYVKNDNARPKAIIMPDGSRMETRFFHYYRNSIINQQVDQYSYKVFWEPIQKAVGQYATIYVSPDGVYNQINLEAIPTPDGRYVIDNSNIVLVSNTKDIYVRKVKSRSVSSTNNASMFGNPTFYLTASASNSIVPLPGTEREVNALQELLQQKGWKTSEYILNSASEERVKELDNPKVFHIATHGFYTPSVDVTDAKKLTESESELTDNPMLKTGLLLKGAGDVLNKTKYNYNIESGILTAQEAMSLNLDKTDLVVLSACETARGEVTNGEGVYGLQRAFLVAGAKTLIMSMFKVDDLATQKLMVNFYTKYITTGNLRQSFIEAKKELRATYPEPIYWGSFMMIGLD